MRINIHLCHLSDALTLGVWVAGGQERTIGEMEKVNFGTDPYLSRQSDASITSDAYQTPQHWEFGQAVDREGQLLLHQGESTFTSDACQMPRHWEFWRSVDGKGRLILHQGLDAKVGLWDQPSLLMPIGRLDIGSLDGR
jgi:hypothetical protein